MSDDDFPDFQEPEPPRKKRGRPRKNEVVERVVRNQRKRVFNNKIYDREDLGPCMKVEYDKLQKWCHENCHLAEIVAQVINRKHKRKCSIHTLEHLIGPYAAEHDVVLSSGFNVAQEYNKKFQRRRMSPCRRGMGVQFFLVDGQSFRTTISQLSCLAWVMDNGIFEYALEHLEEIKASLKEKERKKKERLYAKLTQRLQLNSP